MPEAQDALAKDDVTMADVVAATEPAPAGEVQATDQHALPPGEDPPFVAPPENEHLPAGEEQAVTDADTKALADATEVRVAELIDFCVRQGERMGVEPKALAKSIASQLNAAFK